VHLSTTLLKPLTFRMHGHGNYPPERYLYWTDGCRSLASLTNLQSLRIDMIIWDVMYFDPGDGAAEHQALVEFLSALKSVEARIFQVMLNRDLPEPVMKALGYIPYQILRHSSPHDDTTFPLP
jgi:hypothetical protein